MEFKLDREILTHAVKSFLCCEHSDVTVYYPGDPRPGVFSGYGWAIQCETCSRGVGPIEDNAVVIRALILAALKRERLREQLYATVTLIRPLLSDIEEPYTYAREMAYQLVRRLCALANIDEGFVFGVPSDATKT